MNTNANMNDRESGVRPSRRTDGSDPHACRKPAGTKRILMVEDHPVVRLGLREIIRLEPDLDVVAEAGGIADGLQALRQHQPDLMVLDLVLADGSGFDLLRQARDEGMTLPVLVYSMCDEAVYASQALKAGAQGYITKQEGPDTIIEAIRLLLQGGIYVSKDVSSAIIMAGVHGRRQPLGDPLLDLLTPREVDVFRLLGQGFGTKAIAGRLHISVKTVETHRVHIRTKLRLSDTMSLLREAFRHAGDSLAAPPGRQGPIPPPAGR